MLKHFKIRYNGIDEYVKLDKEDSIDALIIYCIKQGYTLNNITVLETPSKHIRRPLTDFLKLEHATEILQGVMK